MIPIQSKAPLSVIPAQAGTQRPRMTKTWIPACAGMTSSQSGRSDTT